MRAGRKTRANITFSGITPMISLDFTLRLLTTLTTRPQEQDRLNRPLRGRARRLPRFTRLISRQARNYQASSSVYRIRRIHVRVRILIAAGQLVRLVRVLHDRYTTMRARWTFHRRHQHFRQSHQIATILARLRLLSVKINRLLRAESAHFTFCARLGIIMRTATCVEGAQPLFRLSLHPISPYLSPSVRRLPSIPCTRIGQARQLRMCCGRMAIALTARHRRRKWRRGVRMRAMLRATRVTGARTRIARRARRRRPSLRTTNCRGRRRPVLATFAAEASRDAR